MALTLEEIGWRRTHNINLAAALLACGVQVKPVTCLHEKSGQRITEFHLRGDGSLPAAKLPDDDPHLVRARFALVSGQSAPMITETGLIRMGLEQGTLEATDPHHPALDVLRVLEARECLLSFINRGTRYRIQVHPSAPRARYVAGQEEPRFKFSAALPTWETRDTAVAACMARIGVPVIAIKGEAPHRTYVLPRFGHVLPSRMHPEDAYELYQALQTQQDHKPVLGGELYRQCPEHPVVWGLAGCKARLMLQQVIEERRVGVAQVFLHFDRSIPWARKKRSALIEERAPSHVEASAIKHLKGLK
jgi:hypothetical protein